MTIPPLIVRRILGPILVIGLWLLIVSTAPLLVVVAAVASHWLPGRWRALRLLGFALVGLTVEVVFLIVAFVLWVASGFGWKIRSEVFQTAHYAALRVALRILVASASQLFRLTIETDGVSWSPLDDGIPGSDNAMLVLCRHAGPGDSLLLMNTLMNRDHRRRPRTVLKYTMQLDPLSDVYLHRLPARFINPNPASGTDVAGTIGEMATGMGTEDAVVIFPEGGNFTEGRRTRAIAKLRAKGLDVAAAEAESMSNVLPPRPAGVAAALEAAPHADVVFVAHTGLEHLSTMADIWRGIPDHKTLHLRWWFIPVADVPTDDAARVDWLFEHWQALDTWISDTKAADEAGTSPTTS